MKGVSSRVAAYSDFGDKVRAAGCDFVDLELSTADWWAEQNAQESDWARNPVKTWLAIRSGGKAEVRATVARLAAVDRTPTVYGVSPAIMPADPA